MSVCQHVASTIAIQWRLLEYVWNLLACENKVLLRENFCHLQGADTEAALGKAADVVHIFHEGWDALLLPSKTTPRARVQADSVFQEQSNHMIQSRSNRMTVNPANCFCVLQLQHLFGTILLPVLDVWGGQNSLDDHCSDGSTSQEPLEGAHGLR